MERLDMGKNMWGSCRESLRFKQLDNYSYYCERASSSKSYSLSHFFLSLLFFPSDFIFFLFQSIHGINYLSILLSRTLSCTISFSFFMSHFSTISTTYAFYQCMYAIIYRLYFIFLLKMNMLFWKILTYLVVSKSS